MGYKRTETRNAKADEVPIGDHRARLERIGEKEMEVEERKYDKKLGASVKTGRMVPKTFMEWHWAILDTDVDPAPEINDLYSLSWYNDPATGMISKLYKVTEKLGVLPDLDEEFEPTSILGREAMVKVIHKNGCPKIEGGIVKPLNGSK